MTDVAIGFMGALLEYGESTGLHCCCSAAVFCHTVVICLKYPRRNSDQKSSAIVRRGQLCARKNGMTCSPMREAAEHSSAASSILKGDTRADAIVVCIDRGY